MHTRALLLVASLSLAACGSAIAPHQPDGHDCNYAEAATACGASSYCDPGQLTPGRGYARSHTYGLLGDKTHVVGTCRSKGARGETCSSAAACVSGRCARGLTESEGHCE